MEGGRKEGMQKKKRRSEERLTPKNVGDEDEVNSHEKGEGSFPLYSLLFRRFWDRCEYDKEEDKKRKNKGRGESEGYIRSPPVKTTNARKPPSSSSSSSFSFSLSPPLPPRVSPSSISGSFGVGGIPIEI
jgi:hypothetical protein